MPFTSKPLLERLATKLTVGDGCWLWHGAKNANGYGRVWVGKVDGRKVSKPAHLVMYELLVGPVEPGLELDHLCRTRNCVRPSHLEPVTHKENSLRGDTVAARNAAKTHCPQGHEYSPDNLVPSALPFRRCSICARDTLNRYRNKKRVNVPIDHNREQDRPKELWA